MHRFFSENADLVSGVLFCFLDLSEHYRLARVSRTALTMSGLPLPPPSTIARWRKHVVLPSGATSHQLQMLCSHARLTSLTLPRDGTTDAS